MKNTTRSLSCLLAGVVSSLAAIGCPSDAVQTQVNVASAALTGAVPSDWDIPIPVTGDTYVTATAPTINYGRLQSMPIAGGAILNVLQGMVQVDNTKLMAASRGRNIEGAFLEFGVSSISVPGHLSVHRMTQAWTEAGATQLCATDPTPTNNQNDCPDAGYWYMDPFNILRPWVGVPTDTSRVDAGQTSVAFDVTADVRAFVAGTAQNRGWTIRAADILPFASLALQTRETTRPPRLVIQLGGGPSTESEIDACRAAIRFDTTLPKNDAARKFQVEWALCQGENISNCKAAVVGQANLDYTLAARQVQQGTMTPARYLTISRDRSRKVARSENDPAWSCGVAIADEDHDLVPTSIDRCLNTPPLTPTIDDGCTSTVTVSGPSSTDVRNVLGGMGIAGSKPSVCSNSYVPDVGPRVRQVIRTYEAMALVISPLAKPDPNCPVWYEVSAYTESSPGGAELFRFVLRDTAGQQRATPNEYMFTVTNAGQFVSRMQPTLQNLGPKARIRVRTVLANGHRSPWGATTTYVSQI